MGLKGEIKCVIEVLPTNIGINLGSENPEEDCDKLISKYIKY